MSDRKTIIHANDWTVSEVAVHSAGSFGLTMGEIRAFVAAADRMDVPDKCDIYLEKIAASYVYIDERTAQVIRVRYQRKEDGQ